MLPFILHRSEYGALFGIIFSSIRLVYLLSSHQGGVSGYVLASTVSS